MTRAEWRRGAAVYRISAPRLLTALRTTSATCPAPRGRAMSRASVSTRSRSGEAPWTFLKCSFPPHAKALRRPVAMPANEAAIDALRDLIVAKLTYATGRDPAGRHRPRLVRRRGTGAAGPHRRSLAAQRARRLQQEPQARLLPVAGIPSRPPAAELAEQCGSDRADAARARPTRRRPRAPARHRARPGARQWRARAAGRLLHGEHGEPGHSRLRLRHSLQFRAVPAGDPRRLAARIPRELALPRQSVGIRTTRCQLQGELRRLGGYGAGARTARPPRSGTRTRRWSPSPTTRRWSAGAAATRTRCACGRRGRRTRWRWRHSTAATMSARWPRARRRTRSRRSSTRATRRPPARNCGCARSISSPPRRCRTCCTGTSSSTANCTACRTSVPSSSTTPTPRSWSRN